METITATPAKWIGASIKRREDPRLLAGQGRYLDDIVPANVAHLAILRSPHAHARITRIDTSAARAMPGVLAVLTGEDVARLTRPFPNKIPILRPITYYALATDRVRHVGEPVAAVVAERTLIAEDALELIEVDYEPLPAVVDTEKALESDSPRLYDDWEDNVLVRRSFRAGDVDAAFAEADIVLDENLASHRHVALPMEYRGVIGSEEDQLLTIWSSTQLPHVLRSVLSEMLDLPEHRLRVIAPDVGGGFGMKYQVYREEVLVALLTRLVGRPVKWREDIREHLASSTHARDQSVQLQVAARRDGTILGIKADVTGDVGTAMAFPYSHGPVFSLAGNLTVSHKIQNYSFDLKCVVTNKTPAGAYRGYGNPPRAFVIERAIDMLAARLGLDPVEVKKRNLVTEADLPYRTATGAVLESGSFTAALDKALNMADYPRLRAEQAEARRQGRYLGIGVTSFAEGSAPSLFGLAGAWGAYDSCTIRMDPDGKVTAFVGICPQGQAQETIIAQVIADNIGVHPDDVAVRHSDTAITPYGLGAWGSRGTAIGGGATVLAAGKIKHKLLQIAGHLLEVTPEDLQIQGGTVSVAGVEARSLSVRDVAQAAYAGRVRLPAEIAPGLDETAFFDPPSIDHVPDAQGKMMRVATYSNAAHVAVVEVDVTTGVVEILDYVVVHDCGTVINPTLVEGQVRGGVAQGIGGMLHEVILHDEHGQLLTGTLLDYRVPTAKEIPNLRIAHLESPSEIIPGGFKGCGEGGTIGAAAAIPNAVADALAPLGVEITRTPLTPPVLLQLIADAEARRGTNGAH